MSNKKGKLAACSAGSPLVFVNDNHDDEKMKDNCLVNFTVLLKDNFYESQYSGSKCLPNFNFDDKKSPF